MLYEVKTYQKDTEKRKKGDEYLEIKGYYGSLDALIRNITDDSIKQAWNELQDFKTGVEGTLKKLIEENV